MVARKLRVHSLRFVFAAVSLSLLVAGFVLAPAGQAVTNNFYLYVTNSDSSVMQYSLGPTGAPVSPQPSGGGLGSAGTQAVAITPNNKTLMVGAASVIGQNSIAPGTGVLSPGPSAPGSFPSSGRLVITPDITSTYSANGSSVTTYTMDASLLNKANPAPIDPIQQSATSLAVTPDGQYVYVIDTNGGNIFQYKSGKGTLSLNTGSTTGGKDYIPAANPVAIAASPDAKHVYVASVSGSSWIVTNYLVGADGTLKLGGSVAPQGLQNASAKDMVISSDGRFLYVLNDQAESVSAFGVNLKDGSLTELSNSPYALDQNAASPIQMALSSDGSDAYVITAGNPNGAQTPSIDHFTIKTTGAGAGQLNLVSGDTVNPPNQNGQITMAGVAITPLDQPSVIVPPRVDFGTQAVGSTLQQTIYVSNGNGQNSPLWVFGAQVVDANSQFSVVNNGCTVAILGSPCPITIQYAPTANGPTSATLAITSNGGQRVVNVALNGTGSGATPTPTPTPTPNPSPSPAPSPSPSPGPAPGPKPPPDNQAIGVATFGSVPSKITVKGKSFKVTVKCPKQVAQACLGVTAAEVVIPPPKGKKKTPPKIAAQKPLQITNGSSTSVTLSLSSSIQSQLKKHKSLKTILLIATLQPDGSVVPTSQKSTTLKTPPKKSTKHKSKSSSKK